jgi:hypothetical protein
MREPLHRAQALPEQIAPDSSADYESPNLIKSYIFGWLRAAVREFDFMGRICMNRTMTALLWQAHTAIYQVDYRSAN